MEGLYAITETVTRILALHRWWIYVGQRGGTAMMRDNLLDQHHAERPVCMQISIYLPGFTMLQRGGAPRPTWYKYGPSSFRSGPVYLAA